MHKHYLELLKQYVSFQTVSLPGHEKPDQIDQCLNFIKLLLQNGGISVEEWKADGLNPIIFGKYVKDPTLPTVLVYGHYDVVAPNTAAWTKTGPFTLSEENGILYGRGSTDNKGQNLIHILTVLDLIEQGTLAYNIKFFIEGNEETGSAGIDEVIKNKKEELKCDYIMVSDGSVVGKTPVIEASLRGLVNITVHVETAKSDVHSGLYGGAVHNSAVEASKLITTLFDERGMVKIPGFYDGIPEDLVYSEEVDVNNKALLAKINLKELSGAHALLERKNHFTSIGLMPTIEVMGFSSGGGENGFKNIIPGKTSFGLNCRLVGTQTPGEMVALVMGYLGQQTPKYVHGTFDVGSKSNPIMLTINPHEKKKLREFLKAAYGEEPLDKYVGGGIPVVGHFKNILGVNAFLIPFANDDCQMHGPDENIGIEFVEKAFAFSKLFFSNRL